MDNSKYGYDNINRETYDRLIEATYRDLHFRLMNSSAQGSPSVSFLLDQVRAMEAVRDHLFPAPTKTSIADSMAVIRLQQAKFGKMTPGALDADHAPQPARRRGSAFWAKCEVCNQMCQKLHADWVHAHTR